MKCQTFFFSLKNNKTVCCNIPTVSNNFVSVQQKPNQAAWKHRLITAIAVHAQKFGLICQGMS